MIEGFVYLSSGDTLKRLSIHGWQTFHTGSCINLFGDAFGAVVKQKEEGKYFYFTHSQDKEFSFSIADYSCRHVFQLDLLVSKLESVNEGLKEYLGLLPIGKANPIWLHQGGWIARTFLTTSRVYYFDLNNAAVVCLEVATGYCLYDFLITNEFDWTRNLGDEEEYFKAEVHRFIGVHNHVLWLCLNSGRLIGINDRNGTLLYDLNKPATLPACYVTTYNSEVFRGGKDTQIDNQNGQLFGLRNNFYWEVDLRDPVNEFVVYDIAESVKAFNTLPASIDPVEWHGTEIPFFNNETAYHKLNNVGMFDRKKREVVWADTVRVQAGHTAVIYKLAYDGSYLYVMDEEATTHIFKRT